MTFDEVMVWIGENATDKAKQDMLRYGIPNDNACGIPVGVLKKKAKAIGKDPDLARQLWAAGMYEARTLAAFVHDPDSISRREADAWVESFDSWAICDTACFHLMDRTPFAWEAIKPWSKSDREFVRRAAYATIWGLSVHDKSATNGQFQTALKLISDAPPDDRPFVKKAVNMALRAIGKRNLVLNAAAIETANDLMTETSKDRQWVGRHALKELTSDKVQTRLQQKAG